MSSNVTLGIEIIIADSIRSPINTVVAEMITGKEEEELIRTNKEIADVELHPMIFAVNERRTTISNQYAVAPVIMKETGGIIEEHHHHLGNIIIIVVALSVCRQIILLSIPVEVVINITHKGYIILRVPRHLTMINTIGVTKEVVHHQEDVLVIHHHLIAEARMDHRQEDPMVIHRRRLVTTVK